MYAMIDQMDKNKKSVTNEVASLVFYMNGGLDYNDAWLLNADDRAVMANIIEKHHKAISGNTKSNLIG